MGIQTLFEKRKYLSIWNTSYPLSPKDWKPFLIQQQLPFDDERNICFYLHIPFCKQLCSFCEYTRMMCPDEQLQKEYLKVISNDIKEFKTTHDGIILQGFDIGGGTPTALSDECFSTLLDVYDETVQGMQISFDYEPSIEGTFETVSKYKLNRITKSGIRRVSFGIQSTNKDVMDTAHRNTVNIETIKETFYIARESGIRKINVDLMYGLKSQSLDSLKEDLKVIKVLEPDQVTLYELRTNMIPYKCLTHPSERFAMYKILYKGLVDMGYCSTFGQNTFSFDAKDLGVSSYIRKRMKEFMPYKGFGISAQSMSSLGISYNAEKNNILTKKAIQKSTYSENWYYKLSRNELASKYIAISAYCGTFSLSKLTSILGEDSDQIYSKQIEFCINNNLMIKNGNELRITQKGFEFYGAVFSLFYKPNQLD